MAAARRHDDSYRTCDQIKENFSKNIFGSLFLTLQEFEWTFIDTNQHKYSFLLSCTHTPTYTHILTQVKGESLRFSLIILTV